MRLSIEETFVEVFVAITFQQQGIGRVEQVEVMRNENSPEWYAARVHVKQWYHTSKGKAIRKRVESAKLARVFYAAEKYWQIKPNRSEKYIVEQTQSDSPTPMSIVIQDEIIPSPPPLKRSSPY